MKRLQRYSWKTTAGGLATFLAVLARQLSVYADQDPVTVPDWDTVFVAAGGLIVAICARDNDRRSEDVCGPAVESGGSKMVKGLRGSGGPMLFPLLLLFPLLACGCVFSRDRGDIVGITQSVIGIDISQSPADALPHLRIGYVRSQIHVVPTGKGSNGVMHAPSLANSLQTDIGLSGAEIIEDFATGTAADNEPYRVLPTTAQVSAARRASSTNEAKAKK